MIVQQLKVDMKLHFPLKRIRSRHGLLALFALGCSSTPPPKTVEVQPSPSVARVEPTPEISGSEAPAAPAPRAPALVIAKQIRSTCGIDAPVTYFEFDSARLDDPGSRVLDRVALCFTSGPLAGRSLTAVGHADPRGDVEYNLVLGGNRASHVKAYLVSRGLSALRMDATSRGEADATGTDEISWARDRRVDLRLQI